MGFSEKNYQKEIGNMERWKEVFAGIIPKAVYQMQLINGKTRTDYRTVKRSYVCED